MSSQFTLYGSPHSLFAYKVALMLRLSREPFSFRYVSFQKKVHETEWFRNLSPWGQVPVLQHAGEVLVQSTAILEYLAERPGIFYVAQPHERQHVREWLCWAADRFTSPVALSYGVRLGQLKLLPIVVEPTIEDYHRRHTEAALEVLDSKLSTRNYLVIDAPTAADVSCFADLAFAEICGFDIERRVNVTKWAKRCRAIPGFKEPFDLIEMEDAEVAAF